MLQKTCAKSIRYHPRHPYHPRRHYHRHHSHPHAYCEICEIQASSGFAVLLDPFRFVLGFPLVGHENTPCFLLRQESAEEANFEPFPA